jgi:hypothetical protein
LLEASTDIAHADSDLMLPGRLSGAEVINETQRRFRTLPVLTDQRPGSASGA